MGRETWRSSGSVRYRAGLGRVVAVSCPRWFCQFSSQTAGYLKPAGILRLSGRKKVQDNRGAAHVLPPSHRGGNMLAHLGSTTEKDSQFVIDPAGSACSVAARAPRGR